MLATPLLSKPSFERPSIGRASLLELTAKRLDLVRLMRSRDPDEGEYLIRCLGVSSNNRLATVIAATMAAGILPVLEQIGSSASCGLAISLACRNRPTDILLAIQYMGD